MKPQLLSIIAACFISTAAFAQSNSNRIGAGVNVGANLLHADVGSFGGYNGGLSLHYDITRTFAVEGLANFGSLSGKKESDEYGRTFNNNYIQYGARLNVYLYNLLGFYHFAPKVNPYVFAGTGGIRSKVSNVTVSEDPEVAGTLYEGTNWMHQAGAGARVQLTDYIDLNLQWQFTAPNTDLLDGHNPKVYQNKSNDRFSTFNAGVVFTFGKRNSKAMHWTSDEAFLDQKMDDILRDVDQKTAQVKEEMAGRDEEVQQLKQALSDNDDDGVINAVDTDNSTSKDSRVDTKGRDMDTDYDGVPDIADDCPSVPGSKGNGCPDESKAGMVVTDSDLLNDNLNRQEDVLDADGNTGEYKYYVIGGSFRHLENARQYSDALNQGGFSTFVIQNSKKNLNRVAMAATNDPALAAQLLDQFRAKHDVKSWLVINTALF